MELLTTINQRIKELMTNELGKKLEEERGIIINFTEPTEGASSRPTVNIFLYDIRENIELRTHTTYAAYTEKDNKHKLQAAPIYVNFSYIITAWAPNDNHTTTQEIISILLEILLFNEYLPLTKDEKSEELKELGNALTSLEKELINLKNAQEELKAPSQQTEAIDNLIGNLKKSLKNKPREQIGQKELDKLAEELENIQNMIEKIKQLPKKPKALIAIKPRLKMQILHPLHLQSIGEFWSAIKSAPKPVIHCTITGPIYPLPLDVKLIESPADVQILKS